MVKTGILKNGIRIIAKKLDGVKSISIGVFVGVGSAFETEKENGISHFIEHVNFKGTKKRSAFDVVRDPESLGIILNAATSKEYTYYYTKSLSEHTEKALEILSDIFIDSIYPEEELEREKGVIKEEINMYEDTPDDVCATELSRAMFGGGAGYGKKILGSKRNIERFTRQDVFNYKQKYYTTDNVVLSFAGELNFEKIIELCDKYFGAMPKTKRRKAPKHVTTNLCREIIRKKKIEQEHVALGFTAPAKEDELFDEYQVIANVLGGSMSSRLFQTIREKMGLCYTIESYLQCYKDCGSLSVYAGVREGCLDKTIEAIFNELKKFKKEGITEEEFSCVKEQIKSSIVFSEESTSAQMTVYGRKFLFENAVYDPSERLSRFDRMSLDKINGTVFNVLDIENYAVSKVVKTR